jgi:hypothetical protein
MWQNLQEITPLSTPPLALNWWSFNDRVRCVLELGYQENRENLKWVMLNGCMEMVSILFIERMKA